MTVTDLCPECGSATEGQGDHFDLNALSFNQLAPMLNGRIDVNYRLVACTPPSSLAVQVDGSGGPGLWLRLLITVSHHHLMIPVLLQLCHLFCPLTLYKPYLLEPPSQVTPSFIGCPPPPFLPPCSKPFTTADCLVGLLSCRNLPTMRWHYDSLMF